MEKTKVVIRKLVNPNEIPTTAQIDLTKPFVQKKSKRIERDVKKSLLRDLRADNQIDVRLRRNKFDEQLFSSKKR